MEIPENKRQAIRDAISGGPSCKIEAIKLVREATGCGLAEAKRFIENSGVELTAKGLPENKRQAIMDAIYSGTSRKIEAIKLVQRAMGCGLKEAKDFVEQYGAELYAKEPQKFSASPKSKGCFAVLAMTIACLVAVLGGTVRLLFISGVF